MNLLVPVAAFVSFVLGALAMLIYLRWDDMKGYVSFMLTQPGFLSGLNETLKRIRFWWDAHVDTFIFIVKVAFVIGLLLFLR